ncbi:MAG: acetyl-CoA carboxylase carboxyltransferase subunit beta, partial [Chloroflexota bacterium]|nr:acetyl-CoA carboxylase carboxyltransferase subunit beta [Chloroflexota bacterium]
MSRLLNINDSNPLNQDENKYCLMCSMDLNESDLYKKHKVCDTCGFHYTMGAKERIESLADFQSFKEINKNLISVDPISFTPSALYKENFYRDQKRTGITEAVLTGTCSIDGIQCMIIVFDFGFMGGSIGCAAGQKITLAIENATKKKLPIVSVISGGSSRIHEGVLSLMQMAKTTIAMNKHNEKGLPFISIFSNPSTGQGFASFGNLADITIGEPGAILGYNPVGVTQTENSETKYDEQTSESHLKHGLIDAIAPRTEIREIVSVVLDLLQREFTLNRRNKSGDIAIAPAKNMAWHSV